MEYTQRIEVMLKQKSLDSAAFSLKSDIKEDLGIKNIDSLRTSELFYMQSRLSGKKIREMTEKAFTDPILQKFSINKNLETGYDAYIEVKFHEDVTDNAGIIAKETIGDFIGKKTDAIVRSARRYYFKGKMTRKDLEKIAEGLLANKVIENYEVVTK